MAKILFGPRICVKIHTYMLDLAYSNGGPWGPRSNAHVAPTCGGGRKTHRKPQEHISQAFRYAYKPTLVQTVNATHST